MCADFGSRMTQGTRLARRRGMASDGESEDEDDDDANSDLAVDDVDRAPDFESERAERREPPGEDLGTDDEGAYLSDDEAHSSADSEAASVAHTNISFGGLSSLVDDDTQSVISLGGASFASTMSRGTPWEQRQPGPALQPLSRRPAELATFDEYDDDVEEDCESDVGGWSDVRVDEYDGGGSDFQPLRTEMGYKAQSQAGDEGAPAGWEAGWEAPAAAAAAATGGGGGGGGGGQRGGGSEPAGWEAGWDGMSAAGVHGAASSGGQHGGGGNGGSESFGGPGANGTTSDAGGYAARDAGYGAASDVGGGGWAASSQRDSGQRYDRSDGDVDARLAELKQVVEALTTELGSVKWRCAQLDDQLSNSAAEIQMARQREADKQEWAQELQIQLDLKCGQLADVRHKLKSAQEMCAGAALAYVKLDDAKGRIAELLAEQRQDMQQQAQRTAASRPAAAAQVQTVSRPNGVTVHYVEGAAKDARHTGKQQQLKKNEVPQGSTHRTVRVPSTKRVAVAAAAAAAAVAVPSIRLAETSHGVHRRSPVTASALAKLELEIAAAIVAAGGVLALSALGALGPRIREASSSKKLSSKKWLDSRPAAFSVEEGDKPSLFLVRATLLLEVRLFVVKSGGLAKLSALGAEFSGCFPNGPKRWLAKEPKFFSVTSDGHYDSVTSLEDFDAELEFVDGQVSLHSKNIGGGGGGSGRGRGRAGRGRGMNRWGGRGEAAC